MTFPKIFFVRIFFASFHMFMHAITRNIFTPAYMDSCSNARLSWGMRSPPSEFANAHEYLLKINSMKWTAHFWNFDIIDRILSPKDVFFLKNDVQKTSFSRKKRTYKRYRFSVKKLCPKNVFFFEKKKWRPKDIFSQNKTDVHKSVFSKWRPKNVFFRKNDVQKIFFFSEKMIEQLNYFIYVNCCRIIMYFM